jgi:hypothetical protein
MNDEKRKARIKLAWIGLAIPVFLLILLTIFAGGGF